MKIEWKNVIEMWSNAFLWLATQMQIDAKNLIWDLPSPLPLKKKKLIGFYFSILSLGMPYVLWIYKFCWIRGLVGFICFLLGILMTCNRDRFFCRAVLGSVSDYCAHHAHCTVMIVKRPKTKHWAAVTLLHD